uniref:Uncharacterized protein n=1 Tax=Parascaris univalens TaxID=6257 RepID=A0A915AQH3_PARUN
YSYLRGPTLDILLPVFDNNGIDGVMFAIPRSYTSSLVRLCNRAICGTGQLMPRFYHQSPFRRFLEYFTEGGEERFSISGVSRSHAWDRLDAGHWMLIYRDANASRAYALVAVLFPMAMIAVTIMLLDFLHNEPRNRTFFVQKLCKDAAELGMLAAFPILCFVIVVVGLIRVQSIRLFRIYQRINEPHRFIAIVSRSCILQQKIPFDRSLAVLLSDPQTDTFTQSLWRLFVSGTLLLDGRRVVHDDDCFRANNYRSFMLNQTNIPPRKVESTHRS